jgi:hypothetical protein
MATFAVACPLCGKGAGQPCFDEVGGELPAPHIQRMRAHCDALPDSFFERLARGEFEEQGGT